MSTQPRILAFAGSTRTESFNRKLIGIAAKAAKNAGAEVTLLDLRELDLPLYDGDLEAEHGLPEGAKELKKIMKTHDGLLISSPEYNSSISGVLKNAIDWASRPTCDDVPLEAFAGKVAGLMAASPGALGGLRGLVHLRAILGNIKVLVIPEQMAISKANDAFDADGNLKDSKQADAIVDIARKVVHMTARLKNGG